MRRGTRPLWDAEAEEHVIQFIQAERIVDENGQPVAAGHVLDDTYCPKCAVEMEPIEAADVPGLNVQELRLCPNCYLVTWHDQEGIHMRQGVPVTKDSPDPDEQSRFQLPQEPKKC